VREGTGGRRERAGRVHEGTGRMHGGLRGCQTSPEREQKG
jgi:hypothetical protein